MDEVARLYGRSERDNRLVLATPERFQESVDRYSKFLDSCLDAHDVKAAESLIHQAVRWAVDRVAPTLPTEPGAPASASATPVP